MPAQTLDVERTRRQFLIALVSILVIRIAILLISPLDLHFDEAQYWLWSRTLDWGYFSKPPLIAWVIAATTAMLGDAEWAVRLGAPVAHTLGAYAIYALARRLYGEAAGWWAGILWLLLPAIWLSSAIMSTDALLLPLWAGALYCFWRLMERPSWVWALLLGAALGAGALAKYAMLYFPLCAALAAWWSPNARRAILSVYGAAAGALALLIVAPNLVWNALHRFETVTHTASNLNLKSDFIHPAELLEFVYGQVGVLGPVLFVAFIWLLWRAARRRDLGETERTLLAFALPPLIIIMAQALISRANANWAATAYPAAVVLLAGRLADTPAGRRTLWAALAVQIVVGAAVALAVAAPALGDQLGASGSMKRVRGWHEMAREVALRAQPPGVYSAILVDHRALYFELAYYWRDAPSAGVVLPPVRAWRLHAAPENHADASDPMRPADGRRVLVVQMVPEYTELVAGDFRRFAALGAVETPIGRRKTRRITFSLGQTFAPAPRDAAFEARLKRMQQDDD